MFYKAKQGRKLPTIVMIYNVRVTSLDFSVLLLQFCPRVYHHNHINSIALYHIMAAEKKCLYFISLFAFYFRKVIILKHRVPVLQFTKENGHL